MQPIEYGAVATNQGSTGFLMSPLHHHNGHPKQKGLTKPLSPECQRPFIYRNVRKHAHDSYKYHDGPAQNDTHFMY